ncbi:MAG: thymidylate kinase [Acidobacteriaceae bacterium]
MSPVCLDRPLLVSFSGIDGAGKSTQIENLCANLREAGLRVQLLTFWDDAATLKRIREGAGHKLFGGDKGVGSPDKPIERRDKNVRSPLMAVIRLGLYALDALSLRRAAGRALRSGADLVVFDRYLFDELANLNLSNVAARWYLRALLALVPRPQAGLILDADPVQAHERKPEYPLNFLHENRRAYLRLAEIAGLIVVPPLPLPQAKAAVVRCVMDRLAGVSQIPNPKTQMDGQPARPVAS